MRPRHSFRATQWERLETREVLSTVTPVVPYQPVFANLSAALVAFDAKYASTGANGPQAQTIVTPPVVPNGYIDSRITLSRNDVFKLATAVATFAQSDSGAAVPTAADKAAIATFKASLTALDQFIATEPQKLPGGATVFVSGGTTNFIAPLLNGAAPSKNEINLLYSYVSNFYGSYTYGANATQDTVALSKLESGLNLLIAVHPKS
jgi:hypothetical protein